MQQDYSALSDVQMEKVEKQTLRTIVQAIQEYSREAKEIFDNTWAEGGQEVIVLAEDLTRYALEVAEIYAINERFAGFIDYKRVRWMPTVYGLIPQVLLCDAKASTENNRDTLQQSQLTMDAEYVRDGAVMKLKAGVQPHLEIEGTNGVLRAVTTSIFVHFYYRDLETDLKPYRELMAIYIMCLPHMRLKHIYNPSATVSFFGKGKESTARGEKERIRVYFRRLKDMCAWRLQTLEYRGGEGGYTVPLWSEQGGDATFTFIGR
jgi:hypothetical protein